MGAIFNFPFLFARNKKYYTARHEECQYFFENYFSFSPFGWERGNLGQNPGDFWGECDSFVDGKKSTDKQRVSVVWTTGNSTGGMKG